MGKLAKSMPPRTQWAMERLAQALRSEGFTSAQVGISNGQPGHASLFDKDGAQYFFMHQDGDWYLLNEVDADE